MIRRKLLGPIAWGWMPLLSLALAISFGGYCQGQVKMKDAPAKAPASKATAESRSVQVGERFPNFELKDQNGKLSGLRKILDKGPVVLVVYRSADW